MSRSAEVVGSLDLFPTASALAVRKTPFWSHIYGKSDHFTKPGSGRQT
jgi:hypothetical protein